MRILRPSAGRAARSGQVLILLVGGLLLGGSAAAGCHFFTGLTASELDEAIEKCVEDKQREKAARQVAEHWSKNTKDFLERARERRRSLMKLVKHHDVERSAIDAKFAEQEADVARVSREVIDRRFELRAQLTAEEWSAVFPTPKAE